MGKIKSFFKLDIVGVCIVICSIMITAIVCKYQSPFSYRMLAISFFALIILFLLLRLIFIKYEFKFFTVLGFIIIPMVVFVLGSKSQLLEGVGVIIPACMGILMGVLTFVRKADDIKEYKIAIVAVSVFWMLSFINAADFVEVAFDSGDIKSVDVEIQEKAYSVSGRIIEEYSFYVYGDLEGYESVPINVTFEQYRNLETGDKIKVNIGEGLLHRKYYYYEKNLIPSSKFYFWIIDDGDDEFLNYLENEKMVYEVESD